LQTLQPPGVPASEPSNSREAEIRDAVESYRETGEAAVIKRSSSVVYPFDQSQPVVRCSPLRACDIELQPGELVVGVAVGDAERWITSPLSSGDPDNPTPHVIVKPKEYDLATNLVIGTTRRTYHLGLISIAGPRVEAGELAYYRHVAFYYPDEIVRYWATAEELERQRESKRQASVMAETSAVSVDQLNFSYAIKGDKKIAWTPTHVFDDGQHVYIRLPAAARATDLPAVLVEVDGGGMAVSNYRLQGSWYVVDGLFQRAELIVGVGKKKRKVEIRNLKPLAGSA
ncbi:MAG: P-type conjugative transfer protein TrbG, partial [Acidimicrobiia bacterium]|nr:P-type conjugative transfer protein TrbG [Acidimicrobiia bacterium]